MKRGAAAVGLLAFVLYLPGFWWGAPTATSDQFKRSWGIDDESPLGPLAEVHNILEPKPDRNLGYPLMWSFMVAGSYAPYLGWMWLRGDLESPSGDYPFGMADPVAGIKGLTYIAHFLTVLMGTGVAVFAFLAAFELWGRGTAWLTASLVATSYPMFYYARNSNVDVPMLFFVAGATWLLALCLERGLDWKRAAWLGLFVGAALATKESAAGSFLVIPLAFLLPGLAGPSPASGAGSGTRPRSLTLRSLRPHFAFAVAAVLALGLGSGLFVEPGRYIAHVQFITGRLETLSAEDSSLAFTFPYTLAGHLGYAGQILRLLADIMTWPGLLFSLAGLAGICWRDRRGALIPLMGVGSALFLFVVLRAAQLRYLLPAAFALYFAAAWLHRQLQARPQRWLGAASWVVISAVLALSATRGLTLTHEMVRDSRYGAGAWLAERTRPGDRIDFFGPASKLPPLIPELRAENPVPYEGFLRPLADPEAAAASVLERWSSDPPRFIVLVPDLTSAPGKEYNFTCPERVCDALIAGDLGFRQVERFRTEPVFDWLPRPALDYPTVNPPIRIFEPVTEAP